MKDEKKHLYRIDPLKVRQKIYELYPKGSDVHKQMAREEKIKEYSQLARAVSSMPLEIVKDAAEHSKQEALIGVGKALAFGLLTLGFGILLTFTTTTLETALVTGACLIFMTLGFKNFLEGMKIAYSVKNFEDAMKKTKDRMEKLQKDIFE